jgi:hypothetical protein
MARAALAFLAFNRGLVSELGLARADVKRITLSAAEMTNYMPRVLGSMMLRAGLEYRTPTDGNNPCTLPLLHLLHHRRRADRAHRRGDAGAG